MPSSHLISCRPLLLLSPIPPSIRVFSNESTHRMRWPKYWSFSFSIIPSKDHPGLISFRMDWLDLFAVQGTLKSLSENEVAQSCLTLCDPVDCSLPGFSVHGILQARVLVSRALSEYKYGKQNLCVCVSNEDDFTHSNIRSYAERKLRHSWDRMSWSICRGS